MSYHKVIQDVKMNTFVGFIDKIPHTSNGKQFFVSPEKIQFCRYAIRVGYMYSANESSTYMTSVGKGGGGAGGPAKGLAPAHFFLSRALTVVNHMLSYMVQT